MWPDWSNFCHFDKILVLFNNFRAWQNFEPSLANVLCRWGNFEPTLANVSCRWAIFHCCKLPDIEKWSTTQVTLIKTDWRAHKKLFFIYFAFSLFLKVHSFIRSHLFSHLAAIPAFGTIAICTLRFKQNRAFWWIEVYQEPTLSINRWCVSVLRRTSNIWY